MLLTLSLFFFTNGICQGQRKNCYIADVVNAKELNSNTFCKGLTTNIKVHGKKYFKITPNREFDEIFSTQKSLKKNPIDNVINDQIGLERLDSLNINHLIISRLQLKKDDYEEDELVIVLVTIDNKELYSDYHKIKIKRDGKDEERISKKMSEISIYMISEPALVYFATKKELVKKKILIKKGFFLLRIFKRRVLNHEAAWDISEKMIVNSMNEITLPPKKSNFKAAKRNQVYPPRSGFRITKTHIRKIRIYEPSVFWKSSKIAIIVVEKIKKSKK